MVRYEEIDGIATITLEGGRLNLLTRERHQMLCRAMLRFLRSDTARVAVLTSPKGESFSAGDDTREFGIPWGDEPDWSEVLMLLPRDKPVVAAVRDYCLGQGLVYLLHLTDIRFATPAAKLGFPEIAAGMGGAGALTGLSHRIPPTTAARLALTGEMMTGEEAAACHLVNAVADDDNLAAVSQAMARRIAKHPTAALKAEMSPLVRRNGPNDAFGYVAGLQALWAMQASVRSEKD